MNAFYQHIGRNSDKIAAHLNNGRIIADRLPGRGLIHRHFMGEVSNKPELSEILELRARGVFIFKHGPKIIPLHGSRTISFKKTGLNSAPGPLFFRNNHAIRKTCKTPLEIHAKALRVGLNENRGAGYFF